MVIEGRDQGQGWLAPMTLRSWPSMRQAFLLLYGILRFQAAVLPLNPQGFRRHGPGPRVQYRHQLRVSNTNWQSDSGESYAASHFSQMAGLTVQNFVSPVMGMAVAAALARACAANRGETLLGNSRDRSLPRSACTSCCCCRSWRSALCWWRPNSAPSDPSWPIWTLTPSRAAQQAQEHRHGAGGQPGGDQAAWHQRRWFLRGQLRPSVREPQPL